MHIKTLLLGIVIGVVGSVLFFSVFGDGLRGEVSDAASDLGAQVQDVGKAIKNTGKKLP